MDRAYANEQTGGIKSRPSLACVSHEKSLPTVGAQARRMFPHSLISLHLLHLRHSSVYRLKLLGGGGGVDGEFIIIRQLSAIDAAFIMITNYSSTYSYPPHSAKLLALSVYGAHCPHADRRTCESRWPLKQESCAIAKMTAQCAIHMGALKIFGTP